jgi:ketohexokinase/beta-glucosidase
VCNFGAFHGYTKGPHLFWEKEWGTINSDTYCRYILPLIRGYMSQNPQLLLMQDGAPGHGAQATQNRIREYGLNMIYWPPFSPDLNPIEMVWNWMKDFLQANFPDRMNIFELRIALQEAWEAVPESYLAELLESMPERCKAVLEAGSGHTRF